MADSAPDPAAEASLDAAECRVFCDPTSDPSLDATAAAFFFLVGTAAAAFFFVLIGASAEPDASAEASVESSADPTAEPSLDAATAFFFFFLGRESVEPEESAEAGAESAADPAMNGTPLPDEEAADAGASVAGSSAEIRVQIAPNLSILSPSCPKKPPSWKPSGAVTVFLLSVCEPPDTVLPALVPKLNVSVFFFPAALPWLKVTAVGPVTSNEMPSTRSPARIVIDPMVCPATTEAWSENFFPWGPPKLSLNWMGPCTATGAPADPAAELSTEATNELVVGDADPPVDTATTSVEAEAERSVDCDSKAPDPDSEAEAALDADTEADSEKLNNSDAEDSSDTAAELDSEASDDAEAANLMEVAVAETFVEIRVQIAPILTIVLSLRPKNPPSWKPLAPSLCFYSLS
ncbi:hypothetical protein GQ600_13632 [Phytophthora cactorum]|nr:hypothetical protein GQ600_13632 [Phytophthora cactorum]